MDDTVGQYVDAPELGPAIELVNGRRLYLANPDAGVFDVNVIAHALAHLCRFTGHVRAFYSVAQHSVVASRIVPPEFALQALFHDASEAFIGDLSRPLKVLLEDRAPGVLRALEDDLHAAVARHVGFAFPFDPSVKHADNVALATEKRDLMPADTVAWDGLPEPLEDRITPWAPTLARAQFLTRYRELGGAA